MGRDPKPSRREANRPGLEASAVGSSAAPGNLGMEMEGPPIVDKAVALALIPFLLRDDGYLRLIPQEDGATVYYKWKWSGGKYVNHYVMTVYPAAESAQALRGLAAKMHAVDRGEKRPVKDHYFERDRS